MLCGVIVVGGTYYFDSVKMPDQLPTPQQSTVIYYADGKTPMAKLGDENRTIVPLDQIPKDLQHAVVAAEDNTFYTNPGVDIKGVMRAAWNNLTGGDRQGASTITQQYARKMADLEGISYARKLREAVIAMKLDDKYSKDQILWAYLNTVYFGRGAWGVEAAAQAYFKKNVSQLTIAESMVIAEVIKQPEPDGASSPGYDPANSLQNSKNRWEYVKSQMIDLKFVSEADAAKLAYPTTWVKPGDDPATGAQYGLDQPTGFVVHHVMDELSHQTDVKLPNLKNGGYKIITTIDKKMEDAAISIADDSVKGSIMSKEPKNLQAALVSIDPSNGQVLAYYGGHDGSGLDYGGIYNDPVLNKPEVGWTGAASPPGSTFKMYTLATALSQGISIDSYWSGPPSKEFPGRTKNDPAGPVTNADNDSDSCPNKPIYVCTLQLALQKSMNTVFYGVGYQVGPDKVIDMAHALGIQSIWGNVLEKDPKTGKTVRKQQRFDLNQYSGKDLYPAHVGAEVSIGQFAITVLDNATAVATLAHRGVYTQTHFVKQVLQGDAVVYQERIKQTKLADTVGLTQQEVDDETWAMSTVIDKGLSKNKLAGGRQAAAKTGTWQYAQTKHNQDAWYAGFTPQLATVVHITSRDPKNLIVQYYNSNHDLRDMNGANTPGDVWKKFMDTVLKGKPKLDLPSAKHVGDPTAGNAQSPTPPPPSPDPVQSTLPDPGNSTDPGHGGGHGGGGNPPCTFPPLCTSPTPSTTPSGQGGGRDGRDG